MSPRRKPQFFVLQAPLLCSVINNAFFACAAPVLTIEMFGGTADGISNNAAAIHKAVSTCKANGGCTLLFAGPGTYLSSAMNLTSNMKLQVNAGAVLAGTQTNLDNCAAPRGPDGHLGNCTNSKSWPILPWPEYPSLPNRPLMGYPNGPNGAMQAWIRSYNVTNLEISGGGILDGGGPWWWCTRAFSWHQSKHEPMGCNDLIKAGQVPDLNSADPPHMLHLVESQNIHIHNVTIRNSPSWTVHFQYSDNITFENNLVFNPNNGSFEAPNGDGIDIDSSRDVLVRNNIWDVADDALCVKSGANIQGRTSGGCSKGECVGRPSENVLFINNEVRNGHGLTIGSDAAGGVRNVTFRNIFLNGLGGPQAPGLRHGAVGGPHFKAGRGEEGAMWEDITWDNIYGSHVGFGFEMNYHNHPVTNMSATPKIRNMVLSNWAMTTVGPLAIDTIAESPIRNLTMRNITLAAAERGTGWVCHGYSGQKMVGSHVYASGTIEQVNPPLGPCSFASPPSESNNEHTFV